MFSKHVNVINIGRFLDPKNLTLYHALRKVTYLLYKITFGSSAKLANDRPRTPALLNLFCEWLFGGHSV